MVWDSHCQLAVTKISMVYAMSMIITEVINIMSVLFAKYTYLCAYLISFSSTC